MALTKDELITSLQNEVRILQHLCTKIEPSMLDYRPTPKQRSTLELLRYLTSMGPELVKGRAIVLRVMVIGVVVALVVKDSWSTANLLIDLIKGGPETNNPTVLLITGGVVWVANNIVFAMLYWELDSGGPIERARRTVRYPDLAFPGQLAPDIVPPGWRPVFIDYLYLGFTNALAFSPTDVMPLAHWAKLTMALQSFISVAILSLVVARAVNILT